MEQKRSKSNKSSKSKKTILKYTLLPKFDRSEYEFIYFLPDGMPDLKSIPKDLEVVNCPNCTNRKANPTINRQGERLEKSVINKNYRQYRSKCHKCFSSGYIFAKPKYLI